MNRAKIKGFRWIQAVWAPQNGSSMVGWWIMSLSTNRPVGAEKEVHEGFKQQEDTGASKEQLADVFALYDPWENRFVPLGTKSKTKSKHWPSFSMSALPLSS